MVQVSYPGVYIQEIPSGVHTITSVATSITAFIDWFKEGPSNKAVEIFGMTDFQRVFGGLDSRSEASYAISQFFLNGGGTALVVRVAKAGTADKGGVILLAENGDEVLKVSAASEGSWGNNVRLEVDHNLDDATLFDLTVIRYDGPTAKAKPLVTERFLNLTMDDTKPRYAVSVINNESKLITVEAGAAPSGPPAATGTLSGSDLALATAAFNAMAGKKIKVKIGLASDPDSETLGSVTLDSWAAGTVTNLRQLRPLLEKAIRGAQGTFRSPDSFKEASVELVRDQNGVDKRLRITSGRNAAGFDPSELVNIGDDTGTVAADLKLDDPNTTNVQQYQLGITADSGHAVASTSGTDGDPPEAGDIIGDPGAEPHTGMFALDYVDLFNILCIPAAAQLDDGGMGAVVSAALKYCDDRRAFMIIDIPADKNEVQEIKDWLDTHGNFRNNNSAIYFPRPRIPDPKNEFRLRSVGASGTMAGIYARTDSARGVWKAPAGIEAVLNGVVELDAKLTDAQNGTLNPLGINCLRAFPIYGAIAWGARTLEGADQIGSEWKYIPIRRLALTLEESLFRGTKWVVFEPNDEPLWAKIRLNINAYMMSLFRQGAFQGTSPKEAFFVKCDAETTTQDDRNKGIVNILVGFAPLKPAEFVVISIQQIAGNL
jgi:phage tail sheath protein FI